MAIPFYENEEGIHQQQHQQQLNEEMDQVDGPAMNTQYMPTSHHSPDFIEEENNQSNLHNTITEADLQAWKILALAMCNVLKDHYQQNISPTNTNSPSQSSSTAVIQILPNGEVKPEWN